MAWRLPVIQARGKEFYVDLRLKELRAVKNPHERIDMGDLSDAEIHLIVLIVEAIDDGKHKSRKSS